MKITIDTRLANNKEIKDLLIWAIRNKRRRKILYEALYILLINETPIPGKYFFKKMNKSDDRLYKFIREVSSIIKTSEMVIEAQGYNKKGISKRDKLIRFRSRYSVKDKDKAGFIFMVLYILKTVEEYYNYKRSVIREKRTKNDKYKGSPGRS